jgi:hypothetical protein
MKRGLALRVASLQYRRAFITDPDGRDYGSGLRVTSGLILHMGTWWGRASFNLFAIVLEGRRIHYKKRLTIIFCSNIMYLLNRFSA